MAIHQCISTELPDQLHWLKLTKKGRGGGGAGGITQCEILIKEASSCRSFVHNIRLKTIHLGRLIRSYWCFVGFRSSETSSHWICTFVKNDILQRVLHLTWKRWTTQYFQNSNKAKLLISWPQYLLLFNPRFIFNWTIFLFHSSISIAGKKHVEVYLALP